jgi:ribosomal protein S7
MPRKYTRVDLFHLPSTNEKIEKFINHIMKNGKKNVARQIFEQTLEEIKQNTISEIARKTGRDK